MPYKGTIEVISGLKQANNQDFALAKTHDIWADEPDKRLDQVIEDIIGGDSGSLRTKADKANTVLDTYLSRGRLDGSQIGTNSFAFGRDVEASGPYSHAEGGWTKATKSYTHAEGIESTASEDFAHAEGQHTTASGCDAHAEGYLTVAQGDHSHAEGARTNAYGQYSHSEGMLSTTGDRNNTEVGESAHAEGNRTNATANYAHSEGDRSTASGTAAHAEGTSTTAQGNNSHAEGTATTAEGNNSHAEGNSTIAEGAAAHAEGGVYSEQSGSEVEEFITSAGGAASHAEGEGTTATGEASHTEGIKTTTNGVASHAEGNTTIAQGAAAHAEGIETKATGPAAHAEGDNTTASKTGAHAEGTHTNAFGYDSHAEGMYTNANDSAHAEGQRTYANGAASHAEGIGTIAAAESSHVGGTYNVEDSYASWPEFSSNTYYPVGAKMKYTQNTSGGMVSTGYICKIAHTSGNSIATPYWTEWGEFGQKMNFAEIIGNGTDVSHKANARALDWDGNEYLAGDVYVKCDSSSANGKKLATEEFVNTADALKADKKDTVLTTTLSRGRNAIPAAGVGSFAFGEDLTAMGSYSHAEGSGTYAYGSYSHAEGYGSTAGKTDGTGQSTHAEGESSAAHANYSHAEGYSAYVDGIAGHAEGYDTTVYGNYAHSEGYKTVAAADSSHVSGEYNVSDSYANWPEYQVGTFYDVGAKVKRVLYTMSGNVTVGYICKTAHVNYQDFTEENWIEWGKKMNYAEIVGNGTSSARSNARALDWDGNEYLKGDIYVNCDANSANGNKVATEGYVSTSYAPLASPALTGTPTAPTAANGTNTTQIATTAFVMNAFTANDAMVFKGTLGTGGTVTSLPATHQVGWSYKVITAGTYAGQKCEIGDLVICIGTAGTNADWVVVQSNLDGAVTGPTSATVGHVAAFNNTNGKIIKDSGYTIQTSVPPNAVFTDTTYESKTAASGGTDVSLVTTGEKYNWNNKANATDTVLYTTLSRGRKDDTDIGRASFAFGTNVEATKMNSHAEGSNTHATATQAHAEGHNSTASAPNSHAEGNNTVASGVASHAEGYESTASNIASHAEGWPSTASGIASHAEGLRTTASNSASHAEGADTTASGTNSHAEGNATTASGNDSHAEGTGTFAAADFSHVGGAYNVADSYANWPEYEYGKFYDIGDKAKITTYSQAGEVVTYYVCKQAHMNYQQFVEENWDEWGNKMNYVEIIGNGKDDSNRSNVRALGWDGNEYLAGDVYVNCNYLSKQGRRLATEYYVQSQISTITNAQIDALFD